MSAVDRMELMQTFVRIVDSGSLSAAAVHLETTQPTISRRLRSLENLLGVELLLSSTHALKLTDDGERCYTHARNLMEGWAALEDAIKGPGAEPVGRLRVKVPHVFGQDQLVVPLVSYLKRYSKISVDWILSDRPPDFITENIDCAIHVGSVTGPSHVAVLLAEIPRIVVAAPELIDPTKLSRVEQLADLPWIALSTFYMHEIALQSADVQSTVRFPISPRMSSDSLFALHRAALDGLGAAIVSSWIVADDIKSGRLVHLFPQWHAPSLPVYLVYPYASYYPARMQKFFDIMRDVIPGMIGVRRPNR